MKIIYITMKQGKREIANSILMQLNREFSVFRLLFNFNYVTFIQSRHYFN